jgi:intracellular sulfur oxidation DsrE/DsrF family protein
MSLVTASPRRGFLTRLAAAAAALGASGSRALAAERQGGAAGWLAEVKGTHRCLFDFPRHGNGWGLVHVLNYLNTYAGAYKTPAGQVGAVGTFYGIGSGASIALAFNDAMWAKYGLGDYTGLKDASGTPYTRNVFHRPTAADGHLLGQAIQVPRLEAFGQLLPAAGIENLQKMGTKFLICANALGAWELELAARGKGTPEAIDKDLRANLLPGVTIVPAMVIAIEEAQAAGIAYNRQ